MIFIYTFLTLYFFPYFLIFSKFSRYKYILAHFKQKVRAIVPKRALRVSWVWIAHFSVAAFFSESMGTVHGIHKYEKNANLTLKLSPTVLFIYLKIILLQSFLFSAISGVQIDLTSNHLKKQKKNFYIENLILFFFSFLFFWWETFDCIHWSIVSTDNCYIYWNCKLPSDFIILDFSPIQYKVHISQLCTKEKKNFSLFCNSFIILCNMLYTIFSYMDRTV